MRILTISNCPLINSQGSGYVIMNFCQRLRDRGHQVDVFGPEVYEPLKFLKGRARSLRLIVGMLYIVLRQSKNEQYDLIEFYGGESWLAVQILARKIGRYFLMVSHSNGIEPHAREKLLTYIGSTSLDASPRKWYQQDWAANKKAFVNVDRIVTVSQFDAEYALCNRYRQDAHVLAVENSLPDEFLGLPVSFIRPMVIGYCGSWLARKGVGAIEADMSRLLKEFGNCSLQLIGVGLDFRKEEHFAPEVCSRIEVFPFVAGKQELQKLYQNISILIMPSIYESFGLVSAEAMACGCALVASKTGFAASLKDGIEAILMKEPRSPFLYDSIKILLEDFELRIKIAQNGYQRVQSLRWETAVDKLEEAYTSWLKEFRNVAS